MSKTDRITYNGKQLAVVGVGYCYARIVSFRGKECVIAVVYYFPYLSLHFSSLSSADILHRILSDYN
jgi:hypothetical protein